VTPKENNNWRKQHGVNGSLPKRLSFSFLSPIPSVTGSVTETGEELYSLQDATIACTFAHLAAVALGLGSCWIGAFNDNAVRQVIGAPQNMRPVAILPIGVPADMPEPRERRPLSDLIHEEQLRK